MSSSKDLFLDYMYAEATVDAIAELHSKVTQLEPPHLRDGFCSECSFPEDEIYVMFPCETQQIIRRSR